MSRHTTLTDADVIAAIRANHLRANIGRFEDCPDTTVHWDATEEKPLILDNGEWLYVTVDPGGTIFGPGPYIKVPVTGNGWDGTRHRVYAPERLRKRLAARWQRTPVAPTETGRDA